MIRAGAGLSMASDTVAAARGAAEQALGKLGAPVGDLAFLFATTPHGPALAEASAAVREATLARHVVGCLGAGVLTGEGEVEGGAGLAVLLVQSDGELRVEPFLESGLGEAAGRRVRGDVAAVDGPRAVVLFPDVHGFEASAFLRGLALSARDIPVAGGASCDDGSAGRALQLLDDRVTSASVAGAVIAGSVATTIVVAQSCIPAGEPLLVTKAEGQIIHELHGRRAFDAFVRFVDKKLGGDLRKVMALGTAVAVSEEGSAGDGGDYYVRQIVGIDPDSGVLALSEAVEEGQQVAFAVRDPGDAWRLMEADLSALRRRREGRVPAFGLYFNCSARTSAFFGSSSVDTALVRGALGEFPLAGFYAGAELAPLQGRNRVNFFSGVLLLVDAA